MYMKTDYVAVALLLVAAACLLYPTTTERLDAASAMLPREAVDTISRYAVLLAVAAIVLPRFIAFLNWRFVYKPYVDEAMSLARRNVRAREKSAT